MKKIVFILAVAGLIAAIGLLGRAFLLSDKQAEVKIASYREGSAKISAKSVNDDIIKRVNGRKINSISQAFKIYREVRGQNLIKVEIERNDQLTILTYRID